MGISKPKRYAWRTGMTLELSHFVLKTVDGKPLFSALNLKIDKGEVVTVMGASGIGKSTLIDAIGGYLDPHFITDGEAKINGVNISDMPAHKRKVGILFQDANLFPHLNVGQNIAFGLSEKVKGKQARKKAVDQALSKAGLSGFYDRDPASLSGGQKTRVALMRTLLSKPDVLLLDEPFSKLDPSTKSEIRKFVFDHIREQQIPTLLVTHDKEDIHSELLELTAPV